MDNGFRILLALALLATASGAGAGFDAGNQAYQEGDYQRAIEEYRAAAEQGHADAQGKLAAMYLYGVGTATDYQKAYIWFELAARQGDKYAARYRDAAAGAMTREQYEEADARVPEFFERYVEPFQAEDREPNPPSSE